jgi:serine/threonine protein kinase
LIIKNKRYKILKKYGRRNKGVLLLQDPQNTQTIICKYAQKYSILDAHNNCAMTRLKNEYTILKKIAPVINCPQVIDFIEQEYFCYLLLTDVGGDSLDRLPVGVGRLFFSDVIKTVQQLHCLGYVHRDLKRENFVWDPQSKKIYLIDFELAQAVNTICYQEGGTPGYYPKGSHLHTLLSFAHDYYAVGAILAGLAADIDVATLPREAQVLASWVALAGYERVGAWVTKLMSCHNALGGADNSKENNFVLDELYQASQSPEFFMPVSKNIIYNTQLKIKSSFHIFDNFLCEENNNAYFRNIFSTNNIYTQDINNGSSGVLLALHTVYKLTHENYYKNLLLKTASGLASQESYSNSHGLFCGNAGVALALAIASNYDNKYRSYALARLKLAAQQTKEYDLFFGAAGVLMAGIFMSELLSSSEPCELVRNLGEILYENIISYDGIYAWPSEHIVNNGVYPYLGIAHGACGVALALGLWAKETKCDDARELAFEVYNNIYLHGRSLNKKFLRYDVHPASRSRPNQMWCHGVGGFLWGLLYLNPENHELAYIQEALNWAITCYIDAPLLANATFCHGLAGDLEIAALLRARSYKVETRIQKIIAALDLLQINKGPHAGLWPSDNPEVVASSLMVGSLGPTTVLSLLGVQKTYTGILSPSAHRR